MTNNSGNKLALAAALSLLGASLGVNSAQAASTQIKGETSSTQIKGETRATFIKMESYSNQQKCVPATAEWVKLHPAEANQAKLKCGTQSNQLKLDQSNQIKLNSTGGQSNQIKLDTTH